MAYEERGVPAPGWLGGSQLRNMTFMYDHFYKVLWKILMRAERENNGAALKPKEGNGNGRAARAKKGGYAIAFAGVRGGEGASTMAFNFATAFAVSCPKSVVLVDGNLRSPILHYQFEIRKKKKGLVDLIQGKGDVEDAAAEITSKRYYFMQAGQRIDNPIALYESAKFPLLMQKLRDRFDLVIFDSSSVLDNPESLLLASRMDGLVLVVQAGRTRWEVARSAKRDLESAGVNVLGAILNKQRFVIPEAIYKRL